jgi:hypothetical protein
MIRKKKIKKHKKKPRKKGYKMLRIPINLKEGDPGGWEGSNDGKKWKRLTAEEVHSLGGVVEVHGTPQLRTVDPNCLDDKIERLFIGATNIAEQQKRKKLKSKLQDCKHKMYAARYHLTILLSEIQHQVEEYQKQQAQKWGVDREHFNPVLIYETEAFLFQVRSNLDLIIQALREVVPCLEPYDGASKDAVNALSCSDEKKLAEYFRSEYDHWIKKLKHWRDTITHYSGLKEFRCFVEEHYQGGDETKVHFPQIEAGVRADVYCLETYNNLLNFYGFTLNEILSRLK